MEVHPLEDSIGHLWKVDRWRGLVVTVEVRLALLKVDGWGGTKDTGDSRSLQKSDCWSPSIVEVHLESIRCRSLDGDWLP